MTKKLPPPFVYDVKKKVVVVCLCSESSLHNEYNIKKRLPTFTLSHYESRQIASATALVFIPLVEEHPTLKSCIFEKSRSFSVF